MAKSKKTPKSTKSTKPKSTTAPKPPPKKEKETKSLKNDLVEIKIDHEPGCRIKLEVKAVPSLALEARKKAIKIVAKGVSIPGFRKGKAPDELVLKKYTKSVEEKWQRSLADVVFESAQSLANIPVLTHGATVSYNIKSYSLEKGADITYSLEKEPDVPSIDSKKFKLKKVERIEVDNEKIDETIRQMQMFYATWKPVTDRAVKKGDFIIIDLETVEDSQKVFTDTRFEVSDQSMAVWMKKLVIGKSLGKVVEGTSTPDPDLTEKEKKQFKPKKVKITIKKIEEAALPELDDEFAKKVGAENTTQMKESITQMLNRKADEKVDKESREQINEFLLKNYLFDIPFSLVETEKKHRQKKLFEDPSFRARFEKMAEQDRKKLDAAQTEQAENAVRLFYLSRKIVKDANLQITEQEVQAEALASLYALGGGKADLKHIPKEVYALALSKVILAKAQLYLLEQAKK